MSDELKKCPFCGSELVIYHSAGDVTVVRCGDCGARVDAPMGLYRNAHAAWNTRPLEDALQARIDDLEGEIEPKRITLESSVLANKELNQRIATLEEQLRWRPVSDDNLPNDNERVDVLWCGRPYQGHHVASIPQWTVGGIYFHRQNGYEEITHWRPIPELEVKGE